MIFGCYFTRYKQQLSLLPAESRKPSALASKEEVQQQVSITITSRLFSMYYIRIKTILYNTLNKTV